MSFINIPVQCGGPCDDGSVSASGSISASPSISVSPSISASPSLSPSLSPSISASCLYYPLLDFDLVGYGTDSAFAYQPYLDSGDPSDLPTILYVDTTNPSGNTDAYHGSLPWCLAQNFPRIILFETSGVCDGTALSYVLDNVNDDYCWVVGESAPSPGFEVWGACRGTASHILFTNLHFSLTDKNTTRGHDSNNKDAMLWYGGDYVVFDHCTFRWGSDECISLGDPVVNCTISNCLIYEGLSHSNISLKFDDQGSKPDLSNVGARYLTLYRNLYAYGRNRVPWIRGSGNYSDTYSVFMNCVNKNTFARCGGEFGDMVGYPLNIDVVSNWSYRANDDYATGEQDYAGLIGDVTHVNSKFYAYDLRCQYLDDHPALDPYDPLDAFECIYDQTGAMSGEVASLSDLSSYSPVDSTLVKDYVLANSGPINLDAHDLRVINNVDTDADRETCAENNDRRTMDSLLDCPDALPARCVHWNQTTDGDVQLGYDFSVDNQSFDINYSSDGGSSWGGWATITLNADCVVHAVPADDAERLANAQEVRDHINDQIDAEGTYTSGVDIEAYVMSWVDHNWDEIFVAIRSCGTGVDEWIRIDNSTATAIDLWNSTATPPENISGGMTDTAYKGSDAVSGGYIAKAANASTWTLPSNPHGVYNNYLTRLEAWVLLGFPDDLCHPGDESVSLSLSGVCNLAQDVIDNMFNTPSVGRQDEMNALVCALDDAGYWSRMDRLWIMAAHSNSGNTEVLDWKHPATAGNQLSQAGTVNFSVDDGLTSDGVLGSYMNTNFNPSTDGTNFVLNSATAGVWINSNVQENENDFDADDGTNDVYLKSRVTSDTHYYRVNTDTDSSGPGSAVTNSIGLHLITRRGAGDTESYHNGASIDTDTTASTALPNDDIYICGDGSASSTKTQSVFFLMDGISDAEALELYDIFNTYKWW